MADAGLVRRCMETQANLLRRAGPGDMAQVVVGMDGRLILNVRLGDSSFHQNFAIDWTAGAVGVDEAVPGRDDNAP